MGVELQLVPGSGPAGRITHDDLDSYLARRTCVPVRPDARRTERNGVEEIKIVGLRRRIAERVQEAKRRIPHFSYIEEVDVSALEDLRHHLNSSRPPHLAKLTLLPFLMRGLVRVLPQFPQINARYEDESGVVLRHEAVHIGIATQTAEGLLVPVVWHAEALSIWELASAVSRVAAAARDGKSAREGLSGSTITITSLGALGGVATTPIINYPEVAIIGVNRIVERPVIRDRHVVGRKMMNLSSSFDHRVIDGSDAAAFIQALKRQLEQPALLFMD